MKNGSKLKIDPNEKQALSEKLIWIENWYNFKLHSNGKYNRSKLKLNQNPNL